MKVNESLKEKMEKMKTWATDHMEGLAYTGVVIGFGIFSMYCITHAKKHPSNENIIIMNKSKISWLDDLEKMSGKASICFTDVENLESESCYTLGDLGNLGSALINKSIFPENDANKDSKLAGVMVFLK